MNDANKITFCRLVITVSNNQAFPLLLQSGMSAGHSDEAISFVEKKYPYPQQDCFITSHIVKSVVPTLLQHRSWDTGGFLFSVVTFAAPPVQPLNRVKWNTPTLPPW